MFADLGLDDLLEGKADLVIVPFCPEPSRRIAVRHLQDNVTMLLASPRYIKKHGMPKQPEDLSRHRLIVTNRRWTGGRVSTTILNGDTAFDFTDCPAIFRGDGATCRKMVLEGQGIPLNVDMANVSQELSEGKLVPVLPGWHYPPWNNNLCMRAKDARDPVLSAVASEVVRRFYTAFSDSWKFWFQHFGIPVPDIGSKADG